MLYTEKPADFNPKLIVTSCFLEHDGHILLLHRHPNKPQGNTWGVPAGKVEKDESIVQATVREIFEETGVPIAPTQLSDAILTYVRWNDFDFEYHVFRTQLDKRPDIIIDPNAHQRYHWATPHEALDLDLIEDEDVCIKLVYLPDQFEQQT